MNRKLPTFQRQKAIVEFVETNLSAKVDELAHLFTVSQGTIRNDLSTLERQGVLVRVRGGAVTRGEFSLFSGETRGQNSESTLDRITKWAAALVQHGDVILLDASEAALRMASYLREHRRLTVVTPRLDAARLLAADPGKTVILTGGVVQLDGKSVTGEMSLEALKNLHIKTAFILCTAVSLEVGLMESDLQEVQFKRQALAAASRVVALLDSKAFNNIGLVPVAPLESIDQIVTDSQVDEAVVSQLRASNITVTLCDTDLVQTLTPLRVAEGRYRIGFANLSEALLFSVDVRRSLEFAAMSRETIDLVIADNAMDSSTALRAAEHLLDQGVELLIEYQIDENANHKIMNLLQRRGIPAIAIDIPIVGATYFGVDNYRAGFMAGEGLGHWIRANWAGRLEQLLVLEEKRAGALPAARIEGQIQGLREVLGPDKRYKTIFLNSGNTAEVSHKAVFGALQRLPHRANLAVLSFNDDAALGALEAVRATRREHQVAIVGQGADRRLREELRRPGTSIVGSTAFHPEEYGPRVLDIAIKILQGKAVPPAVYVDHTFVTAANVNEQYPEELAYADPEQAG